MANTDSTAQIIPYYSQPHVYTVIRNNTYYDENTSPADTAELPFSTCVVTGADSGIDNTFVRLTNLSTKKAIFGQSNYKKYGQPSIQADALFNGNTNVWFCRVLPDNATYANVIFLAHYRKGDILNELGQKTGKVRLEIKFSIAYANKPALSDGAVEDSEILEFANTLASKNADPKTGYITVPICYARMTGRGKYGNLYGMSIQRDTSAEKEYGIKMYKFNLISNVGVTKISNIFSGSLYPTTSRNVTTLISDVLEQYSLGSCPISIHPFEDNIEKIYNFYKEEIVLTNTAYINSSGTSDEDELDELAMAQALDVTTFDPLFGYQLNTKTGAIIPYYRNYTVKATGPYVQPDYTVPASGGATKPLNKSKWSTAFVGARVLVIADPVNGGGRWLYTVRSIDPDTGDIVYDEGIEAGIDDDQFDGVNIAQAGGHMFDGGHDGDFQEITVDGITRAPSSAEMKLLLSREYVKAFRGEKDRKILSPARIELDFMFDANYNMTSDESLVIDTTTDSLYGNSTILTDEDARSLSVLGTSGYAMDFSDLNVKQAMYDLNEFRNRNGMTVSVEMGAGCSLMLDCNFIGLKSLQVNYELLDIISMFDDMTGRATSVDLGYYDIYDPNNGKRIPVTVSYFLAKNLIPHLISYGINKPFTYNFAQLTAVQRDSTLSVGGDMIRDSFRPDIDLIDWDVKEQLYKSRINYYITTDEGRTVQRACQNTRELDPSALLEENNVRVLNTLKKGLEKACRGYLYEWNEPTVRKAYTDSQMEVYRPWIGTMVQNLNISFEANEFEQERMMMHCYVSVAFRDIIKRIILEIGINRPTYSESGGDE